MNIRNLFKKWKMKIDKNQKNLTDEEKLCYMKGIFENRIEDFMKEYSGVKQDEKWLQEYSVEFVLPVCIIANEKFSWVMYVDDMVIPFNGSANAEYFAEFYKKLGYCVDFKAETDLDGEK